MNEIVIPLNVEPRVDTRVLADHLGLQHQNVFEMVKGYKADFEQLGLLRFQTGKPEKGGKGGRPERSGLLNEDQCYLLLTYSRNSARVRELKVRLVKAFKEAREARRLTEGEYLPAYHQLHDTIHRLAEGSSNERFVHMNVNKAINKAIGIDAGTRNALDVPAKSLVTVAQMVADRAMQRAQDHHDGYESAKVALTSLRAVICGPEASKSITHELQ